MEQSTFATAGSPNRTVTNNEVVEKDIREICAEVLRRPVGKIKLDKSFIAQGGDSLLAIKLMARCGEAGYTITINDMLQATSIRELCQSVKLAEGSSAPGKLSSGPVLDGPAQPAEIRTKPLTEAQKLYASTKAWDAKVFKLEGGIAESTLYAALKLLVSHHPILRANFTTLENNDLGLTYNDTIDAFAHRRIEIPTISTQAEQGYLTVGWEADGKREDGLFAATVFVQKDRDHGTCLARYLRLDFHRAIIDVSSWDILQRDLDHAVLGKPLARGYPETSFDSWASTHNLSDFTFRRSTPVESTNDERNTNERQHNRHQNDGKIELADVVILETDAAGLAKLEDESIHSVLRTQPEDFIVAALHIALKGVTRSEETLSFGIISNGRHSGGPKLSATVGCFDNIIRRSVERAEEDGGLGFLRKVKDTRMGFFNVSRISGVEDRSRYVLLHMGQLGRTTAPIADTLHELFHQDDFSILPHGCLAFVEPFLEQQQLKLRLRSRSAELGREKLGQLAGLFRAALKELIAECEMSEVQGTLSDFPFLKLTYSELDNLVSSRLKAVTGDPFRDVEAVFPCGPRQEAFLVAQAVYPDLYQCSFVIKLSSEDLNVELDCGRLRDAWVRLVARHPALRTVFIESPNRQGHFDQVVMKQGISSITFLENEGEEAARRLACRRPVTFKSYGQTHQVTFCRISPSSVYLRLDMSHAVVDGLSALVLMRDLFQLYSKQKLASRVMAYQDFVNYQSRLPMQESMTYWSNYLAGAQPSHFPLYGDQLSREDLRTVRSNIQLGSDVLGEFCAWALVLRSYTGLEDVCFSYATSGRDVPLKGINNTVGAFLNAVVCRIKLPPTATVPQALVKARNDFVESLSHQYYLALDDAQSGDFARFKSNTLMSCQRKAATELAGSGLAFELVDAANPNEYDMSINIQVGHEGLEVMIDYWNSRIGQRTVESVAQSFRQALLNIVKEEDAVLGEIDISTTQEINQLREWAKEIPPKADYRIHDKVYEQRLRRPDAWAVQGWDGDLTYQQLDDTANQLASYLIRLGVQPETKIPICFEKSKWAVISQLAILKAGGCVVPLGTTQPASRTRLILKDLQATIILTSGKFASRFMDLVTHTVVIDEAFMAELPPSEMVPCLATVDNAAFIIYTSGSTGVPKGVVLPHASLCTSLEHMGARFKLSPDTRTVQFSAYTFDISIQDIYTTWHYGGCLIILSEEDRISNLAPEMVKYQVNCAGLTSTVAGTIFPQDVPTLKKLVLLGEAVKQAVVDQWIGHVEVYNAYGPSECSMQASINRLTPGCNALNIGWAFAGALWVVDPNDYNRLVPIGAPGELLIEGPLQARGYLNSPEKTAAAFVVDAAWMIKNGFGSGRRLYRTGDLVQQNPDGSITYIGRRDTQIKVRGQRVEVGEIEHHLLQQDAVLDAAIIYPKQGPCKDRLVGLLTLRDFFCGKRPGQDIIPIPSGKLSHTKSQLAAASEELSNHVPEHMVPKIWIPLESMMPQNDSSKLDRKKLGVWLEAIDTAFLEALTKSSDAGSESREPETLLERQVQQAWADVLRLPPTQIPIEHKSFLSVGGDSITAMHVVSWLRVRGITVAVRDVLESKSVAQLAQTAEVKDEKTEGHQSLLSPMQKWYFESIADPELPLKSSGAHRYNSNICLVPRKLFEYSELAQAVGALVDRHPILRSRFQRHNVAGWQQSLHSDGDQPFALRHYTVSTSEEAEALIVEAQGSLDLEQGPVFFVEYIQVEDARNTDLLFMTAHRLVVDEVSWDIIRRDISVLLEGQQFPTSNPLSFQTWIKLQAQRSQNLEGIVFRSDLPPADFKYWGLNDGNTYEDETVEEVIFNSHDTNAYFRDANRALRTERVEILLAALLKSFQKTFPNRRLPAVFEINDGRNVGDSGLDFSNTVGNFECMTPIHIFLDEPHNGLDIVRQTKDARRSAFGRVLSDGQQAFTDRWVEVLFQYSEGLASETIFETVDLTGPGTSPVGKSTRRGCVFNVNVIAYPDKLRIRFKFNRNMKYQEKIRDWADSYANAISALGTELSGASPTLTVTDFPLLHLTSESLRVLQDEILPDAGLNCSDVEDIYPCSPIQQGILISQVKSPSEYYIQQSFEIIPTTSSGKLDHTRLLAAWQVLINRHPMLRTRFVRSASGSSERLFDQVVLKSCKAEAEHVECTDDDLFRNLAVKATLDERHIDKRIGHKLTIYSTSSNRTFGNIIISHALVDASSLMIIQAELAQAYDGKLAPDTIGAAYSEYISHLQKIPADQALDYWAKRLADAEPCYLRGMTEDGMQPATADDSTPRRPMQTVSIDINCIEKLHSFTETYGVTIANVFQLVWAMVLAQYTGSPNVSFGYLSSGRDVPVKDVETMVGPLINMMVTHIKLDMEASAQNTLKQIQENFFESFNYQRAPLVEIWHALQLQGRSLFNTALSYRHIVSAEKHQLSLALEQITGEDPTEYDVTVSVFASPEKISASLQYSPDFLSYDSANRLLGCVRQGIQSLVTNGDTHVGQLNTVTPKDILQVRAWNDKIPAVDGYCLIHDLFNEQRLLRPNATAVCAWDGDLTYQQLDEMSNALAHHLVTLGIGPEVMVALCLDKSKFAIIAQLSVLKAAGVVVSINPKHPTQRLELVLKDINAKVMLTSHQYSSQFRNLVPHILHMDETLFSALSSQPQPPSTNVTPNNAAFIIYTSGSTGMPKGVILTHLSLCSSFRAHGKIYEMSPSTRSLQFAAYTFDASISDIWGTMSHGGCVCVISEEERMNNLQGVIEAYGATHAQVTPTVASLLDIANIKCLTTLILGGEAVREAMIEEHAKAAGRVKVLNGYGPSECSIYTTCSAALVQKKQALNIGRPLVGSVWVIANGESICPIGAVGELWVEGPLLARGYHNDPKKTKAAFVTNPKWAKAIRLEGHRFYNTGDLVRQSPNGDLIYQARKDSQVKVRGQRVEIGEIEYRVKKLLPAVKSLVASLITPGGNSPNIMISVAMELSDDFLQRHLLSAPFHEIFLPNAPHLRDAFSQLHASLLEVLPSYMVPRLFVPVVHLPQTTSSKLDRRTIKQMLENLPGDVLFQYSLSTSLSVAPSTFMEKKLQSLWATVLNVDQDHVGVQDHFLHCGGDSFTAMRLVSLANAKDIPISVADVFRYPKLQEMAAHLEAQMGRRRDVQDIPRFGLWKEAQQTEASVSERELLRVAKLCDVAVHDIEDVYPCTPLQEGLMAITTQQPGSYIGRWVFRIQEAVDTNAFKRAWSSLTQKAPILRTRIAPSQSGGLQVVVRESVAWGGDLNLKQYLDKDLQQSFGYGQPLVRQALIYSGNKRYFVLTAHHSVYDGYSLRKLFDAVALLYDGKELAPTPAFSRFISYIGQQDLKAAKSFWQSQIKRKVGAPFPSLHKLSYRPQPTQKLSSSVEIRPVGGPNTLASSLRAAWALAISAYGGNDVLFGVALSGRSAPVPGILDMAAPTITTVPVHVHINPEQTINQYLTMVHKQSVDMIPFEHTGLQNIRRFVGQIDLPHLFAVQPAQERESSVHGKLLAYEHGHVPELNLDGYALTVECVTSDISDIPVTIEAHFDERMISASQTNDLLSRFSHIVTQLVTNGRDQTQLKYLDLLSKDEARRLFQFNQGIPPVKQALVHELVSQHVSTNPYAPAVCAWDGDLTREELDRLANKLALYLTTLGVIPETMVALCFEKSKWALVANLAVLKAGGAVVPIRADPIQRVQNILQQTGITTILASEGFASALEGLVPNVITIGDDLIQSLPSPVTQPISTVTPSNAAFVIFTSGSTGNPKGVVVEHGAMSTSMQAHGKKFGMNSETRAFNFAHFTFDISLHDIISTLQFGGCVCMPSERERVNNMADAMNRMGVNYSFLPPRVIHTIKPSDVPGLKTLVVGGEAVQPEYLEPWLNGVRVFNAYGPAECSIAATCNEVANKADVPNIGRAIAGGLWVVDENNYNRLLPLGAVGELLIEGPLLARGYLNDPIKTANAFICNPAWISRYSEHDHCSQRRERRMYRTGDLVRQMEDGSLIYVGRRDGQVKIRGQRVEIGEIEHHVTEHPSVVENVIVYPHCGPAQLQLVGILTLHGFISSDADEGIQTTPLDQLPHALQQASSVRDHLHSCIPEYMVPNSWISLAAMPHNSSDKIDRRRLTQWLETMEVEHFKILTQSYTEGTTTPSTSEEKNIQAVWADVLHASIGKVPMSRPFLAVGGDSVTAMQVVSKCRSQYSIYVTVRDVLQCESISQLAKKAVIKTTSPNTDTQLSTSSIDQAPAATSAPTAFDINASDLSKLETDVLPRTGVENLSAIESIYYCSPIQQGILMSQIKDHTTYQVRQAGEIRAADSSPVDMNRLLRAWQLVVQRHAILRTFFVPSPSGRELFYQVVLKRYTPTIPVLQSCSSDDFLAQFEGLERPEYAPGQPPYQLTLAQASTGQVYAQVDVNHVLMDASSMDLILNDLILAYDNMLPDSPAPSYGIYVSFLQQTFAFDSLNYWTNHLAGAEPSCLPASSNLDSGKRSLRTVSLEVDNIKPLQDFRDTHGVTIANITQLAWATVLSRYLGSRDVSFGYISNGRDAPIDGIHEMCGPMINLMVSRVQLAHPGTTVAEAAKQVQHNFLDAFNHQRTSLSDIQHALHLSERGLFNTTMIYKPKPMMDTHEKRSLVIESLAGEDPTEYDVQVKIVSDDKSLSLDLEYATTFIDEPSARRLLGSFGRALSSIAANPDANIDEIDVIPTGDVEVLHIWNSTVGETVPGSIHDKIHEQALSQPGAQAVCGWDGELTYAELTGMSDRLAHHLRNLGVREEVMVGLCFDKSMWTIVSMIAVLKSGGVIVPLGVQMPVQRLQHILNEITAPVVLTMDKHASKLRDITSANVLTIDGGFIATLPNPCHPPSESSLTSESAAVVIYTSGSTGTPKGVVLTHGTICTSIESHGPKLQMGPNTRALQYSAYVFDLSLLDILSTLRFGGCVCVVSEEDRVDTNSLTTKMEAMAVNFAVLTPTVASLIDPRTVPTLSTLVLAGEVVPHSAVETWASHVTLFNGYGPAESTILATTNGPIIEKEQASSVGTALAGAIWVVDTQDHNRLVPLGVVGELLISGPLVARGYLNDTERTSQSFITDPAFVSKYGFHSWAGKRIYKTGDLVRQDPTDGSIMFVGRADGQIKIRGQRVEVGEIEYWLRQHFDTQTVAVDVIGASTGDVALVAAIELRKDRSSNECVFLDVNHQLRESFLQLQAALLKALPSYMVPSKYIPIKNMPNTASGKLDRRALRTLIGGLKEEQLAQYSLADGGNVALSTETERRLARVWVAALNTSKEFGANAHFFRVGGDSVTAMRLVALARTAQPPILLSVSDVFKHPVLSDMANTIANSESTENCQYDNDVPPFLLLPYPQHERQARLQEIASQCKVEVDVIEDAYPCTPLQQGLMAITAQHPQAYISRWVFRLEDTIDESRFCQAWRTLVELNPILRTRIIQDPKAGGMQVVLQQQITWNNVLSELPSYIAEDSAKPMGFGDPLVRLAVVTSRQARFFVWTAHHSTYDGWTARKLMEAAFALYSNNPAPSFHPFTRFVQYLQSNSAEETRDYWKSQLEGGIGPSFPGSPKNGSPRKLRIQSCRIPANNSNDFTLSTLLRATWALILSQETGSQIVGFPTALSGRTAPVDGILDVLGPTITTVPIRVSVDPAQSLSAYLASIQQQATEMLPFEHAGLHNISRMTSLPLNFQHLFVVQPAVDRLDQANSGFQGLTPVPFETYGFHNYPLVIECSTNMTDTDSAVDLQLQFDPAVLSVEKATTILERFTHVFGQLQSAANEATCEVLVSDVIFMTPEDLGRIQKWNHFDERMTMADGCIHDLVHHQLLSCPDAQAVHAFDGHLTYRELHRLATRLAYHLEGLGVGPQVPVATIFEKTKWVVVTYLAVLKAGGTIVPVNHQHPKQRMQALVQSIGTRVILTSQDPGRLQGLVTGPVLKVDQDFFTQLPDSDNPHPVVQATDSAFIIFTSGSTGTSKAVVLQHGAIVSSMVQGHGSLYASPDTRAIQFSALNFDISIAEIFTTLSFGGCVCVISEDDRVSRLAEAMEEAAVNFAILTPTVASLLKPEQVPSLRRLLLVGEALRPEVAEPWSSSHVELHNAYGPAESSILTTFSQRIRDPVQAPNIGFPLAHSNLFVVDPSNYHNLLPVGMVGELLIEGPLLAREYLGDAKKTAEAFVTDPAWLQQYDLGPVSGRRFYRTGDLVQQKLDGSFIYIGRRDTQVKIHGQRVEIGEIEFWVKNKLPDVREVVAGLFKPIYEEDEPLLAVAMEVPSSSVESSGLLSLSDELREAFGELRRNLLTVVPSYMVPQLYLPFAKLPLTDSGKLNRRATWEMIHSCGSWSQYFLVDDIKAEPATVTERLLQSLWATVLKVPASSIGAKDDFFRSGGDSISAMRLVASAREDAHISLKVADVFRHPILSDMATLIDRKTTVTKPAYCPFSTMTDDYAIRDSIKPLLSVPSEIIDVAPTTDLQSLSIATSLRPSRDLMAYVSIDGIGSPNFARWRASCLEVVKKHDILRTAYVVYKNQLLQVVLRDYAPAVTHYQTDQSIEEFTKEFIAHDMHRPPQLGYPFLEFAIICSPVANRHRVLFRLSHAEYDAISLSYFVNSLREIYQRQSTTEYVGFPQYISSLANQDTWSSREYWRSLLKGCTMPAISSSSQPRRLPSRQVYHDSRRVSFKTLPAGITLSTIVRSAWALTLGQHVGNPDVLFGEVVSGRNGDPIAERAAGCCANLVPVRATIHPAWTTHDLLRSVQQQLVSRLPHESLGFRDLMRNCTDMPVGTVFTSLLNHLDQASEWTLDLDDGKYNVSVAKTEGAGDVSDVSVTSTASTDYVEIAMAYLEDGVTVEVAEKLLSQLCETVDAFMNGALDAELPTVDCVSELNAQGVNEAPKFEGDLVDASLVAFELQKRGHEVTVDEVVDRGLSLSGV
ncbi:protein easA [Aspergillus nidulans FGSC A4]|uniref:Nonribosomal peptide synthetase easA n=1 Tax=Emericella nidulans (strain FGSC A4 / ATCC 38163 / CBS 112.46 / NRRL 194 / M139) TaxID=227321 RepID=EASA_EMENI|nr:protein easA [Aspergillus nidulans FGSC A4]C8VPS9.1 RecName: Full=Nonribosomal peptide synthetase easA; AltName: Full=Emericellamide biosynthesis protein A [Aspergillus nidulans FGSC A4]CBF87069.1 TPA: nonribosomal peptide synthase, putative (Eurofung) [Aspergillus nidulans FGSC A4]